MTMQSSPYPRVTFLIRTFADWLKHRREIKELRQLDRGEFERIAADLEISSADLDELVRHAAASARPRAARSSSSDWR